MAHGPLALVLLGAGLTGAACSADATPIVRRTADSLSGGDAGSGDTSIGGACATQSAEAMLLPLYLAFAFDVSGSMGKGDQPWHDRTLKWDPVVSATRAFFEDAQSSGIHASLTFFPSAEGDDSVRCDSKVYESPDVPMSALPSTAFGKALDDIGQQEWRGSTPTQYVMRGVLNVVRAAMVRQPGKYALVLVTDGYPQDCDDNSIEAVAAVAAEARREIPTYVLGVKNPPIEGAPDVTSNLNQIAIAGGTEQVFMIGTGDPASTITTFRAAVDSIRGASLVCDVGIPAPPVGSVFDKERVVVRYSSENTETHLVYDASCLKEGAWHYDDANRPARIVLCPSTCAAVQPPNAASINVEFSCEKKIDIPI
ncbi:MAG TPA: vWA domain-containing protein [Polyangiaceae bacterium]|nr:vWA domain-containing protein [Polyangiaceae bacterium]